MVDKFKKLMDEIIATKGHVTLFAVVKMDDLTDKWSIMLAAPWADEAHRKEAFNFVFRLLPKHFNDEERNLIARIGIFDKSEHIIELLLQYKKGAVIENERINGNVVHHAYVLESDSNA